MSGKKPGRKVSAAKADSLQDMGKRFVSAWKRAEKGEPVNEGTDAPSSKNQGADSCNSYKYQYIQSMKPIEFRGSSLDDLRGFPHPVMREAGYQLDRVQHGLAPSDAKAMASIGPGVTELRIWDEAGTFRVIYVAKLADAVYVLHCFQKKTQQTAKRDIDLAKQRLKELMKELAS
jgi:phage-related protein